MSLIGTFDFEGLRSQQRCRLWNDARLSEANGSTGLIFFVLNRTQSAVEVDDVTGFYLNLSF